MWPGQAGRPKGGQSRLGWRPSPHLDTLWPGPATLTCLASPPLQFSPFPLLSMCGVRAWEESPGCRFSSRNLYILFKKASKPGKAWDEPS